MTRVMAFAGADGFLGTVVVTLLLSSGSSTISGDS
jgi:hypothetical protein